MDYWFLHSTITFYLQPRREESRTGVRTAGQYSELILDHDSELYAQGSGDPEKRPPGALFGPTQARTCVSGARMAATDWDQTRLDVIRAPNYLGCR